MRVNFSTRGNYGTRYEKKLLREIVMRVLFPFFPFLLHSFFSLLKANQITHQKI